MKKSDLLVE